MRTLLFEISAPFGHFRNPYTTAYKQSYPFPPKPTVVGMLGAMLGWAEKEVVSRTPSLKVGIPDAINKGKFVEYGYVFGIQGSKAEIRPERFELLVEPQIQILVGSEDEVLIDQIGERITLRDFIFPIYMGKNEFPITDVKVLHGPLSAKIENLRVATGVIAALSIPSFKMTGAEIRPPFAFVGVPLEFSLHSDKKKRWRKLTKTYNALLCDQNVELIKPLRGFETELGSVTVI